MSERRTGAVGYFVAALALLAVAGYLLLRSDDSATVDTGAGGEIGDDGGSADDTTGCDLDQCASADSGGGDVDDNGIERIPVDSLGLPVSIEPGADLTDGQLVTVTATGFPPLATVGWAQCWADRTAELGEGACDNRTYGGFGADRDGLLTIDMSVWRHLEVAGTVVDCAAESCMLAFGALDDLAYSGTVALHFDPTIPAATGPVVTATPIEGLIDRDPIAVSVEGNGLDGYIVRLCLAAGEFEPTGSWCAVDESFADQSTGWTATIAAARLITGPDGLEVDCADAAGTCELVVDGPTRLSTSVPLHFDPTVDPPPPPSVAVTPATDLTDGQAVTVEGAGFRAPRLTIVQCAGEPGSGAPGDSSPCDLGAATDVASDHSGFTTSFVVRAVLDTALGPIDCRLGPCYLGVGSSASDGAPSNLLVFAR